MRTIRAGIRRTVLCYLRHFDSDGAKRGVSDESTGDTLPA